jgi:pyruvate/2-oxoglutarate dehydrogenase complex dihydrolipoamide acyltransferase (E2) component
MNRAASAFALLAVAACSTKAATSPADGPPVALSSAAPVPPAPTPAPTEAAVAAAPPAASVAPAPSANAAPAASASAAASASPADAPLPAVRVANIGMHIGGGPNDDATKDPIRRSVQPHFDEIRRCFAQVEEAKTGDFGLDLRIDRAGGKAKVSHPRTTLKGKDFRSCVVSTFEGIDFLKPKGGTTNVSYSLRFTPLHGD